MYLLFIIIFLATMAGMELVAWFTHKYIMHGLLWSLHKDHHTGSKHKLERNDWFSLSFALPSLFLIYYGLRDSNYYLEAAGAGMTTYGAIYFIVHDVFIHQRIALFRNVKSPYLKALRRAHKLHHKHLGKAQGESFGFLIVSKKHFQQSASLFDNTIH